MKRYGFALGYSCSTFGATLTNGNAGFTVRCGFYNRVPVRIGNGTADFLV